MPNREQLERAAAAFGGSEAHGAEGAYCTESRKIAIVSPFPGKLHALVRELTGLCYDVMLFHRSEPLTLIGMQMDLVIIDAEMMSVAGESGSIREWIGNMSKSFPLLWISAEARRNAEIGNIGGRVVTDAGRLEETIAEIEALLERLGGASSSSAPASATAPVTDAASAGMYAFKDIALDMKKMAVTVSGSPVVLTKTEYQLLLLLLEAEGAVLPREDMMSRVWGSQFFGGSNVVDVHMKSLRKKLGDSAAAPRYIVTVRGVGYRLAD